jgi:hypothetical protein
MSQSPDMYIGTPNPRSNSANAGSLLFSIGRMVMRTIVSRVES